MMQVEAYTCSMSCTRMFTCILICNKHMHKVTVTYRGGGGGGILSYISVCATVKGMVFRKFRV